MSNKKSIDKIHDSIANKIDALFTIREAAEEIFKIKSYEQLNSRIADLKIVLKQFDDLE